MTAYQNKRIAKALGRCWHELELIGCVSRCKHCGDIPEFVNYPNEPFDTWEGFKIIIEHGPKHDWWTNFMDDLDDVFWIYVDRIRQEYDYTLWAVKQDYLGPQLAIALNGWLEGRE